MAKAVAQAFALEICITSLNHRVSNGAGSGSCICSAMLYLFSNGEGNCSLKSDHLFTNTWSTCYWVSAWAFACISSINNCALSQCHSICITMPHQMVKATAHSNSDPLFIHKWSTCFWVSAWAFALISSINNCQMVKVVAQTFDLEICITTIFNQFVQVVKAKAQAFVIAQSNTDPLP